jgi:DNA-binding GntR family transcriptional regulator
MLRERLLTGEFAPGYDIIKRSHDDHHRILRAIVNRDGARAEALMREHVLNAGEVFGRFVQSGRIDFFGSRQASE